MSHIRCVRAFALAIGLLIPGFAGAQPYDPYAPPREESRMPTISKGKRVYDPRLDANVRYGVSCSLTIYGEPVFPNGKGLCNIGRAVEGDRSRTTLIFIGSKTYKIVRSPQSDHYGFFYDGERKLSPVTTKGTIAGKQPAKPAIWNSVPIKTVLKWQRRPISRWGGFLWDNPVIKFHWGNPKHPTEIRAWTRSSRFGRKDDLKSKALTHHYVSHKIARWYGVSFGHRWFIGFLRFDITRTDIRSPELPAYLSAEDRAMWGDYDNWPMAETED